MRKQIFIPLFFLFIAICSQELFAQFPDSKVGPGQLVTSLTKVFLPDYPTAHNPSLIDTDYGLLMTFRWLPDPDKQPWISYIGVVFLDESLQPISKPQLLDTRVGNQLVPSQSEDARVFLYEGELYLIFNDNFFLTNPKAVHRRDIHISRLLCVNGQFIVSKPLKLYHQQKYFSQKWQKNWVPFVWQGALLLGYSLIPHEILYTDLDSGECFPFVTTPFAYSLWDWKWGTLRGGTPATLVDGEYLAFFHSSIEMSSVASGGIVMHHYFLGAYTFSDEAPFAITKITSSPIMADGFYTRSSAPKRVIFPGGYVVRDQHFYLAYGKDDHEAWIATIDREKLKQRLVATSALP